MVKFLYKVRSKRGASAVLLTCIFISLVTAAGAVGEAASRKASVTVAECTLETAGRSVLAGYDRGLKERYALFGYELDEREICEEIKLMSEEPLKSFPLTECRILELSVEKSGYCLADIELFGAQIEEIMKYKIFTDRISEFTGFLTSASDAVDLLSDQERKKESLEEAKEAMRKAREDTDTEENPKDADGNFSGVDFDTADSVHDMLKKLKEDAEDGKEEGETENRVLRNGKITEALPSVLEGCSENSVFSGVLSSLSKFTEFTDLGNLKSEIYINEYILEYFSKNTDEPGTDRFFSNEVEYILYGSDSDRDNYKRSKRAIRTVRTALNMAYIYRSPQMVQETLSLAESLTPGPLAPLTQLLIIAAWSSLESYNDMKNLEAGNRIPLMKSSATWKISLSFVRSGEFSEGMIENDSRGGLSYGSYLKLLLLTEDTETKLLRMMDLIQINMKGSERKDFVLSNLFCGFIVRAQLEKRSICAGIGTAQTSVRMVHTY